MNRKRYVVLSHEKAQELFVLVGTWLNARQAMAYGVVERVPMRRLERLISDETESAGLILDFVRNHPSEQDAR